MKTPIADFLDSYAKSDTVRAHMPGHKGCGDIERFDLTEIAGADSLYEASGIIAQSEKNASEIFGCNTFYSTEGSSLCIRAMLYLVTLTRGRRLLASRNAHRSFISACALLDIDIEWLYGDSYLSCNISPAALDRRFASGDIPDAVYITSPDYLGNVQDISGISKVCKKHGVLLLVDNAHGAYLKFLGLHPIDLGADIVCDSAHKTLPVLTGGAYLHIKDGTVAKYAKTALALFGSTSPSYLILRSLDKANAYLEGYGQRLRAFLPSVKRLRGIIPTVGDEPLKVTFTPKPYGYTGTELCALFRKSGIECEFCDPDYTVLMLTPENGDTDRIYNAISAIPKRAEISDLPPTISAPERVMSVREAMTCLPQTIATNQSVGKVAASFAVGCPPAVPIVVSGERINESAACAFEYYGIQTVDIIKE